MSHSLRKALACSALALSSLGLPGLAAAQGDTLALPIYDAQRFMQLAALDVPLKPLLGRFSDEEMIDGGVPCQGYYIIWVGGYPVKVWYPSGCTPPQ